MLAKIKVGRVTASNVAPRDKISLTIKLSLPNLKRERSTSFVAYLLRAASVHHYTQFYVQSCLSKLSSKTVIFQRASILTCVSFLFPFFSGVVHFIIFPQDTSMGLKCKNLQSPVKLIRSRNEVTILLHHCTSLHTYTYSQTHAH